MSPLIPIGVFVMLLLAECLGPELPPRDHVHHELRTDPATGPAIIALAANVDIATVIYSSEGFLDRNGGHAGRMSDPKYFPSIEDAQNYGIEPGYTTAYIVSATRKYVWHPRFQEWLAA